MIKYYFKTIWKNILKNKLTSFINITGLSVGMTAAIFIFVWVENEISFDSYNPKVNNLYCVTSTITSAKWYMNYSPLLLAKEAKSEIPEIDKATRMAPYYGSLTMKINEELFTEKKSAYIDKNWFDLFHYDFIEGSPESFFSDPFSIAMTESTAKKYFGNRNAIGQVIVLDSVNYVVRAVVKNNPANSSFQFDVLIPIDAHLSNPSNRKNEESWNNSNYLTFLRLNDKANPELTAKKLTSIILKHNSRSENVMHLLPLKKMHFETGFSFSQLPHSSRKTVYIFTVLALLLLLIACINYVNLTTAQASLRSKEVSVKKIVGASRGVLFKQFLAESFFISVFALIITLILVQITAPLFDQVTGKYFQLSITSPILWKVLAGTLIIAAVLNGIYPAIMLSSFKPLNVFRGKNVLNVKDTSFRKILVVAQFTISVALIIGTIVINSQLNYIQNTDPGYNRAQVFAFNVPYKIFQHYDKDGRKDFFNSFKQELANQSSIKGVTLASQSIVNLTSTNSGSADWEGHDTTYVPTVSQLSADADFNNVFQLSMKEGRWFLPDSKADDHNFILNETAVEQFNIHKPVVGQRFSFQGDSGQVIGVVKDFHYKSMHEKIGPMVIFNNQNWRSSFFVRGGQGQIPAAIQAAQKIWKQFAPNEAFDYTFLDENFDNLYKTDKKASALILIFSLVAVIISGLGLFGLTVFSSERRVKEIGIRKILGATFSNILVLLSKDFIILVLIASVIAFPIAWWAMNKWLEDFAYRIHIGWWIFFAAGLLAVLIALITISVQAVKAAIANPVQSLRIE